MRVRTVFQPHVEIDVPDDEAEALRLQGLLHVPPPEPQTAQAPVAGAEAPGENDEQSAPPKAAPKQQPTLSAPEPTPATEKG